MNPPRTSPSTLDVLHTVFVTACAHLYYDRIRVIGQQAEPRSGGTLYVGLHRNGAVDGFVYKAVLPRATFMVSTQLRRNFLGRLFFRGIEVVRTKDEGNRGQNTAALARCLDLLRAGGELFIFPEGTSTLGPRHLPFKSGAAHLWTLAVRAGIPLRVIPVGIHYEEPWAFRSRVEVVVGNELPPVSASGSDLEQLRIARRAIEARLGAVGINIETSEEQDQLQRLAYVTTLGADRSYFESMKRWERGIPADLNRQWQALQSQIAQGPIARHQGVPLVPMQSRWLYGILLGLLIPVCALAALMNGPVLVLAYLAGKQKADAPNVIALWRALIGIPVFILWVMIVFWACVISHKLYGFYAYLAITLTGIFTTYRCKKLAVAVYNGFRRPELIQPLLSFRNTVLEEISHS